MPYISLDTSRTFLCVSLHIQSLPCVAGESSSSASSSSSSGFPFPLRWGASCVVQAGLKFLGSSNPPASAPQIAGTIGACHCTESVHHSIAWADPSFLCSHPDFIYSSLECWGWSPGLCVPWARALSLCCTPRSVQFVVSKYLTHLPTLSLVQVLLQFHCELKELVLAKPLSSQSAWALKANCPPRYLTSTICRSLLESRGSPASAFL